MLSKYDREVVEFVGWNFMKLHSFPWDYDCFKQFCVGTSCCKYIVCFIRVTQQDSHEQPGHFLISKDLILFPFEWDILK